jgi:hypothetical protein
MPDWLLKLLTRPNEKQARQAANWRTLVNMGAEEGRRNTSIARLTGHLLRRDVDARVTHDLMQAWNAVRCKPPLDHDEVTRVVASIAQKEAARRGASLGLADPIDLLSEMQKRDRIPPAFTDEALALRFAECHADDLRYVAAWSRWLSWEGHPMAVRRYTSCISMKPQGLPSRCIGVQQANIAAALASAKTVAAIERLAKSDRRLAATVSQWDADPWLLNTPGGVVDLRTGAATRHSPDLFMTRTTAVAPAPGCPNFLAFLKRAMAGDDDLVAFLQRVFGYALTGSTREHALLFCYGTGANGKSVLLSTVAGIMGDYHRIAPIETFTASTSERHPTDLAGLRGARLVTAIETEEGRRWLRARSKR